MTCYQIRSQPSLDQNMPSKRGIWLLIHVIRHLSGAVGARHYSNNVGDIHPSKWFLRLNIPQGVFMHGRVDFNWHMKQK